MENIWTTSKWTQDELDHATVQFRIPIGRGFLHGVGEFRVRQNPQRLLSVELVTDQQGKNWAERIVTRWQLPQSAIDRIEKHPDQAVAVFRLV